jgi:hypothetical protein
MTLFTIIGAITWAIFFYQFGYWIAAWLDGTARLGELLDPVQTEIGELEVLLACHLAKKGATP